MKYKIVYFTMRNRAQRHPGCFLGCDSWGVELRAWVRPA